MSLAGMIRRMAEAGANPEAIAIAVEEIEALQTALASRRAADRDRKRAQRERQKTADVTGQSEDSHGTVTDKGFPNKEPPQTPQQITPSIPPLKGSPPSRGGRLPDDFTVPDEWIDWAISKRRWSRADAVDEGERFCRYWQAKTGRDATKRDWFKTWQNWVTGSKRPDGCTSAVADESKWTAERRAEYARRLGTGPPQPIGKVVARVVNQSRAGAGNG